MKYLTHESLSNILKTYGVFRCPASYDSAGSDYDSAGSDVYNIWLPLVIGFGLVIFSVLYGYRSFKNHRGDK